MCIFLRFFIRDFWLVFSSSSDHACLLPRRLRSRPDHALFYMRHFDFLYRSSDKRCHYDRSVSLYACFRVATLKVLQRAVPRTTSPSLTNLGSSLAHSLCHSTERSVILWPQLSSSSFNATGKLHRTVLSQTSTRTEQSGCACSDARGPRLRLHHNWVDLQRTA